MGNRSQSIIERCSKCRMQPAMCVCSLVPRLALRTRVAIVMHRRERLKTTNTGQLALHALANSALFMWGDEGTVIAPEALVPAGEHAFVLTPGGRTLTPEVVRELHERGRDLTMVVPDATWRQANKMVRRIPAVAALPRYGLPQGAPSRYLLRSEPREDGLATIEAIARALALLEGPEVAEALERPFHAMVAGTLRTRGRVLPAP